MGWEEEGRGGKRREEEGRKEEDQTSGNGNCDIAFLVVREEVTFEVFTIPYIS
jgi:hypothetical protein